MINLFQNNTIEKYGPGIGRIINYFKEVNSPLPTFENHSSGFLVSAYATSNEDSFGNVTENVTEKRRQKIIKLVEENNKITTEEIAKLIGVVRRTIARDIDSLKENVELIRIGSDKSGYWKVCGEDE